MKNKLLNRIIATVSIIACSLCLVAVPTNSVSVNAAPAGQAASGETAIAPCAEILEWVYGVSNGKRYKRLLNCTTGQWVTDWIYVGEA